MARRPIVDVFGMSMLDTVTCGLGAAIMLLVVIATQVEAKGEPDTQRSSSKEKGEQVAGSDDADKPVPLALASLIHITQKPTEIDVKIVQQEGAINELMVVSLSDDRTVWGNKSTNSGIALWHSGVGKVPEAFILQVTHEGRVGDCRALYIADAYYRWLNTCSTRYKVTRNGTKLVYELEPIP